MGTAVTILVDVEEERSAVPRCLEELGVRVQTNRLPAGDYVVAPDAVVERKTVRDLHASLVSGMLWGQLYSLRRDTAHPYLLVEGVDLDRGRVSRRGVRGALLHIGESGVAVVRSQSAADTASSHADVRRASRERGRVGADVDAP
jgi:ERCC4-type nuclease